MLTKRDDILIIRELMEYIGDHYREDLSIKVLCKKAGINRTKLNEGFFQMVNMTPHSYIQKVRMEQAKTLLETTTLPIKVIGLECGYKSTSSFGKIFRKLFGLTPLEYHRMHKE